MLRLRGTKLMGAVAAFIDNDPYRFPAQPFESIQIFGKENRAEVGNIPAACLICCNQSIFRQPGQNLTKRAPITKTDSM